MQTDRASLSPIANFSSAVCICTTKTYLSHSKEHAMFRVTVVERVVNYRSSVLRVSDQNVKAPRCDVVCKIK